VSQLLLDIKPAQLPTLENFVAGGNAELISRLHGLADRSSYDAVYLWGRDGCGKSHLLAATVAAAASHRPATFLVAATVGTEIATTPGILLAVDDIQELTDAGQIELFRIFNAARLAGLTLLLAGNEPPARLVLREDLRTRIGQTLVYEMKLLSDDEKSAALARHALMRGMRVDDGLVRYLLAHSRRDLPTLMAVLDSLDRATLEQQRPATLPLLKEVLQLQFDDNSNHESCSV
jgi:DnaA family protein